MSRRSGVKEAGAQECGGSVPQLLSSGVLPDLHTEVAPALHVSPQGGRPVFPVMPKDEVLLSWGSLPAAPYRQSALWSQGGGVPQGCLSRLSVCTTQTSPIQEASTHQALCPGSAASLQRKGPFFLLAKVLSAQPSPWGPHLPEGASFELAQKHCADSPGPSGLAWHGLRRLRMGLPWGSPD